MSAISEPLVGQPPQESRQKPSGVSIGHHSIHSDSSFSSLSSPPEPTPPERSPIIAAFERVSQESVKLQTSLLGSSTVRTGDYVNFRNAVVDLLSELQHLPDDVNPTPVLISAIEGRRFEVDCFGSSAESYRAECKEREEKRREVVRTLKEATDSACVLLELAARAVEEAQEERNRLEESESDTDKAEQGSGSGSGLPTGDRPPSRLVPVRDPDCDRPVSPPALFCRLVDAHFYSKQLQRWPSISGYPENVSLTNSEELPVQPSGEPSPPSTPDQPAFSGEDPLTPTKRPSRGKYDARYLRESVRRYREGDPPPPGDSLSTIGHSASFPTYLPKHDPDDLDAPYVEYDLDGTVKKANLRGLVGVMTSGSAIEHEELVSMVLTTFRLFASGKNLADALYFRCTEEWPGWSTRTGIKARVATVLYLWLEFHWRPEDSGAIMGLRQLVGVVEEDCAFHARSLRTPLDRIAKDRDYHGQRFRKEERCRPTVALPPPALSAEMDHLATLAARNPSTLTIAHFARTSEGVVQFARMVTMVESRYYRRLSPFVDHKSYKMLELRKELRGFEQRYKAWIGRTIVDIKDPVERSRVIEFWFEVAKVRTIRVFISV